ncbi:MAG: vitamin K epoxide reductase family protein [Chloroflexi bacterium]|nr:vitamin K epoxide reductase family protein [Chloroflexota bacterium]
MRRLELLAGLCAAGVAIGAYLSYVALDATAEPFCSGLGSCSEVQGSAYARVAGVPVAVLGLLMYATLLALVLGRRLGTRAPRLRALPLATATFTVALAGSLYSAYLTALELLVIDAICAWCVASALLVTAIAALAAPDVIAER